MSDFLGAGAVVVQDSDADPPGADRAAEAGDLGGVITAGEVVGEFGGFFFVIEAANLHRPAPALVERYGRAQDFKFDGCDARLPDVDFFRGGIGEIDEAAFDEGATISNADHGGVSGLDVGDAHHRSQRQGEMSRREGVHVINLAVGSVAVVIGSAIPAGDSGLDQQRLGISGNLGGFFALGRGRRRRLWSGSRSCLDRRWRRNA